MDTLDEGNKVKQMVKMVLRGTGAEGRTATVEYGGGWYNTRYGIIVGQWRKIRFT